MKNIQNYNFNQKKVIIRADLNVPLNGNEIIDDTRIQAILPTIHKVRSEGGSIILISHLGRPTQGYEAKLSLRPIAMHLQKLLSTTIFFF